MLLHDKHKLQLAAALIMNRYFQPHDCGALENRVLIKCKVQEIGNTSTAFSGIFYVFSVQISLHPAVGLLQPPAGDLYITSHLHHHPDNGASSQIFTHIQKSLIFINEACLFVKGEDVSNTARCGSQHPHTHFIHETSTIILQGLRGKHLPTLMRLADRKWLQGRLAVLMTESPSVVTVVLDLSDGLGESVTIAILAATDSMTAGA